MGGGWKFWWLFLARGQYLVWDRRYMDFNYNLTHARYLVKKAHSQI